MPTDYIVLIVYSHSYVLHGIPVYTFASCIIQPVGCKDTKNYYKCNMGIRRIRCVHW